MSCCSGAFHRQASNARKKTGREKGTRHRLELVVHTECTTSEQNQWPHRVGDGQVRPTSGAAKISRSTPDWRRPRQHAPVTRGHVSTVVVTSDSGQSLDWPSALALHFFLKRNVLVEQPKAHVLILL